MRNAESCQFKSTNDATVSLCEVCRKSMRHSPGRTPKQLHRVCTGPPGQKKVNLKPAAAKLGISVRHVCGYGRALRRWTWAGFPMREQAEVERIEAEICRPCEMYDDGHCGKCGCRVSKRRWFAVLNKIKMATESCPLGKW